MATTETAAEKYARLKDSSFEAFLENSFSDESLKGVDLYEVTCPSGMTFKCRRIDLAYSENAGSMPMALTQQMLAAQNATADSEDAAMRRFAEMSPIEQRAAMQASAQMVRYICVEPRLIVGEVNGHRNAISVEALTMTDFGHLSKWAGGDTADGLKTFRSKRK